MRNTLFGAALTLTCLVTTTACDSDTSTGVLNLGVAGASCVRTPDCMAPLQCIANVCSDGFADTVGDVVGGQDTGADAPNDAFVHDVPVIADTIDGDLFDTFETSAPDTSTTVSDTGGGPFGDCGALGIDDQWVGTFSGDIDYMLSPNPLVPEVGILPVGGMLNFEIQCIESKFVVDGMLDGTATVVGQGDFPFTLGLKGLYDPTTEVLSANMVDGVVSIYGIFEVYFEGTFSGLIQTESVFSGTWDGESTGTNQAAITGTATGAGVWNAIGN